MAEMTDIRCEECGAVFPMIVGEIERREGHAWYPGKRCPLCGSEKFFPVVKTDKAELKPLAKWKVDRRVGIAAGIAIFVFLLVGAVWYLHERPHRKGGEKAVYVCGVCGKLFLKGVAGNVPKKCPECKSWAGYRGVQCLNCYAVYAWKVADTPASPVCPKCKKKQSRILVGLSDVQKKPPKTQEEGEAEGGENEEEKRVHPD